MEKKPKVVPEVVHSPLLKQTGTDVVGFLSRIDAGSDGYRKGLLLLAADCFRKASVDCVFMVGGLVSKRGVSKRIQEIHAREQAAYDAVKEELLELVSKWTDIQSKLKDDKKKTDKSKLESEMEKLEKKMEDLKENLSKLKPRKLAVISSEIVEQLAKELAEDLPHFENKDGRKVKVYIVTSPAYDGSVGHQVALRLVELRKKERDVLYFGQTRAYVQLKKCGKGVVLLTPEKAVWRSPVYSSYPDRLVGDDLKRGSKNPPDMYVVGCFGSSLNRGKGSKKFQRISLPALHKLEDTTTGENMIGIRVVWYGKDRNEVRTYDFKHLTTNERSMITLPANCSKIQALILEDLKVHGSRHIGQWEDELGIPRDVLEKELKELRGRKNSKSSLLYNDQSTQYSFDPEWMQKMLRFSWPEDGPGWALDTVVGFSCAHAGSVHTAECFIVTELADILVEVGADVLFDAGDTIEGLKHDLDRRKEVLPGFNYTKMERLAAYMLSTTMLRALEKRLDKALEGRDAKKIALAEVEELVYKHLVAFIYICGNHDDWEKDEGFDPLALFDVLLRKLVEEGVDEILRKKGLPVMSMLSLKNLTTKKVLAFTEDDEYTFPSGMKIGGIHYHAGRTAANSAWPERALAQFGGVHQKIVGNFHVEEQVEEYSSDLGLRASDMLPTLKCKSDFESKKGKIVDFGVGVRRMWSYKGKMLITESGLRGKNPNKSINPDLVFEAHLKDLGIDKK